jgi:putative transposase
MARALSRELREAIVGAYNRSESTIAETAILFGISERTVNKYLRLERENGDLTPGKSTGRPGKITDVHDKTILKIVKSSPDKTLSEYCDEFYERTGIIVGTTIMFRAFEKLNIRRKKKSYYASEQDRPDVKKKTRLHIDNGR